MMNQSSFANIHAIVPLNVPNGSKKRLSRLLDVNQRARLTITMLINVLSALKQSTSVRSVTVVCADREIQAVVEGYGAAFLLEARRRGLNLALAFAMRKVPSDSSVLIIHADLPLLTSHDVDNLVRRAGNCSLALGPSKDGTGTNAILMRRPNMIPLAFGKSSFHRHYALARKMKLALRVVRIHGVAFDVDDEQDLDELVQYYVDGQAPRMMKRIMESESAGILPILVKSR
jgi:2-phospho-L-lactate guanylyltransferase